jgi:hypothetical protein
MDTQFFRAGAITDFTYPVKDSTGTILSLPGIAVDAPVGITIGAISFDAQGHHFTIEPDVSAVGTSGALLVTGTDWADTIPFFVTANPSSTFVYGSLQGVVNIVGALASGGFTSTSNPTDSAVNLQLSIESADIDNQLSSGGYVTPVTDPDALTLLNSVCERLAAAFVLENRAAAVNPSLLVTANGWRTLAYNQLARALVGRVVFANVPRIATHRNPSVGNTDPAISQDRITAFKNNFGGYGF